MQHFQLEPLIQFPQGGGGLNFLDKLGLDTLLGRCFLNIVNGFCINMGFFYVCTILITVINSMP